MDSTAEGQIVKTLGDQDSTALIFHEDSDQKDSDEGDFDEDARIVKTTRVRYKDHKLSSDPFIDDYGFFEDQLEAPSRGTTTVTRIGRSPCQTEEIPQKVSSTTGHYHGSYRGLEDKRPCGILKRKKKGTSILKRKRSPEPEEADNAVETTPNCYPSGKKTKIEKKVRWSEWAQVSSPTRPYETEKDDPGVKFIHFDPEQQDDSEAENDAEEQESSPEPIED